MLVSPLLVELSPSDHQGFAAQEVPSFSRGLGENRNFTWPRSHREVRMANEDFEDHLYI